MVRRVKKGGMVIWGTEIGSRGGSKGRVEKFRQTWQCLVQTEAVVQEVFDWSPLGLEWVDNQHGTQPATRGFWRWTQHERDSRLGSSGP